MSVPHVVLRRKKTQSESDEVMSVYNDSKWEVPEDYPERPTPPPHPGPHPDPHYKPTPVDNPDNLKFGLGLQYSNDTLSVKVDQSAGGGLSVTERGLSMGEALKKIDSQARKINELTEVTVDLKSQVNKLKAALSPAVLARMLAESFDIFVYDDGELKVNVGDGLKQSESGVISVDAGSGLKFEGGGRRLSIDPEVTITVNENKFGVNIDNDTIKVNEEGQIESTPASQWVEYNTNSH